MTGDTFESMWPAVEQFLKKEGIGTPVDELAVDPARQRLSSLCYIEHRGRLLMLKRKKPPFVGHWTAPGGKLQTGEDPRAAIRREVREETGLELRRPRLRLVASETGPEHYNWLLFFFHAAPEVDGVDEGWLRDSRPSDEGRLAWLPVETLASQPIPGVERMLLPYIFPAPEDEAPYFAAIRFGDDAEVTELDVGPLR